MMGALQACALVQVSYFLINFVTMYYMTLRDMIVRFDDSIVYMPFKDRHRDGPTCQVQLLYC